MLTAGVSPTPPLPGLRSGLRRSFEPAVIIGELNFIGGLTTGSISVKVPVGNSKSMMTPPLSTRAPFVKLAPKPSIVAVAHGVVDPLVPEKQTTLVTVAGPTTVIIARLIGTSQHAQVTFR